MSSLGAWYRGLLHQLQLAGSVGCRVKAVGNLRNCGLRNAEGNLRNVICGATVIGQQVRPRDCSYSSVYHWVLPQTPLGEITPLRGLHSWCGRTPPPPRPFRPWALALRVVFLIVDYFVPLLPVGTIFYCACTAHSANAGCW